jgi:hypothetical protein
VKEKKKKEDMISSYSQHQKWIGKVHERDSCIITCCCVLAQRTFGQCGEQKWKSTKTCKFLLVYGKESERRERREERRERRGGRGEERGGEEERRERRGERRRGGEERGEGVRVVHVV